MCHFEDPMPSRCRSLELCSRDCAARRLAAHLAISGQQSSCELFTAAAADDDEYSSWPTQTSCSAPPRGPPRGPAAAATRRAPSPHAPSRARPSSSRGQHGSRWWSRGRRATLGSSTGPGGVVRLAAPDALGPCWMIVCGARALSIEQSLRVTWAGPVPPNANRNRKGVGRSRR